MMEVLQPVRVSPVLAPKYDNTHWGNRAQWIDDNTAKLARYWSELGKALGVPQKDQEDIEAMAYWIKWQYESQVKRS